MTLRPTSGRRPLLVVLVGPLAVGKTALARQICARFPHVSLVSNDEIRAATFASPGYGESENLVVYRTAIELIRDRLIDGSDVVYDGTNVSRVWRSRLNRSVDGLADVLYVRLDAPASVLKRRLAQRDKTEPLEGFRWNTWWDVYAEVASTMQPLEQPHIVADSSRSFAPVLALLARISGGD